MQRYLLGYYRKKLKKGEVRIINDIDSTIVEKNSHLCTNEDTMHMMLVSSDPLITNLKSKPYKKNLELSDEAKELISS